MTTRMWVKLIVVLAVLLFMVLMGMSNDQTATFRLFDREGTTQAAIMYFIFFGVGVVTGAVLALGSGKSSRKS